MPDVMPAPAAAAPGPLVRLSALKRYFDVSPPLLARVLEGKPRAIVQAVDGVDIEIGKGETFSLVGESGEETEVATLVLPIRDLFAAIFFVSVGMLIDPALVLAHWPAILVLTAAIVVGKTLGVSLGAIFTGNNLRTSVQAGMSLAQIGEFSFIIASLGLTLKATGTFLYPVAVTVSALTTLLTPWLIRASGPVASRLDHMLPASLQTFVSLYGSWLEKIRTAPRSNTATARLRRDSLIAATTLVRTV